MSRSGVSSDVHRMNADGGGAVAVLIRATKEESPDWHSLPAPPRGPAGPAPSGPPAAGPTTGAPAGAGDLPGGAPAPSLGAPVVRAVVDRDRD